MSREEIDRANNVLQTVEHQLAKAVASRDLAKLDLERTVVRAPADGWVTNLNVYNGEFITRGSTAVALVKQNTFYVVAYLEETKLEGVRQGYRAEITPLGSSRSIKGTVDSIAAGVTNASSSSDAKGWLPWILTLNGFVWRSACRSAFDSTSSRAICGLRGQPRRW